MQSELIQSSVVNVYLEPVDNSEVNTQVIYASQVAVIQRSEKWAKIKTADGEEGWIHSSEIIDNLDYQNSKNLRSTKNLYAHIYKVADTISYPPILTLPFSTQVLLEDVEDYGQRWFAVKLINGERAWIQRGDLDFSSKRKTLDEILTFCKKFLGLPYTWGGTSSWGFDCSGFVQMLYKEMGVLLPRNAKDQAQSDFLISVDRKDLQPGDLIFFGKTRINHVGMYLGDDEFIHSGVTESPVIMISNLNSGLYSYQTARRLDLSKVSKGKN